MSVDYSQMKTWLNSAAVRGSAEALPVDGATYAEVASGARVWGDLEVYFDFYNIPWDFFGVWGITSAGESVSTAASTMAKHLIYFADRLEQLEQQRGPMIDEAKELNRWFANRSRAGYDVEDGAWEDKAFDRSLLEDRISRACREYEEICEDLASSLRKMEDDGSDPNPILGFFTGTLKVGVFVAGFIPPVAGVATLVGAGIAINDAYQARSRELKEEHPELSTIEIRDNAITTAIVTGGTEVAFDVATSGAGNYVLGEVVDLPPGAAVPISNGASQVVSIPVGRRLDELTGDVSGTNSLPTVEASGGWPVDSSPYLNPGAAVAQMQEESAAQDRVREIKDYDGDGYTDPAFRPGSDEVKSHHVKPATVVVTPEDDED